MTSKPGRAAALKAALAEELPFHAAAPRLAAPNADLTSDRLGPRIELLADEFGIVRPSGPDAVRLADALGLAVLRAADQEAPAEPVAEEETSGDSARNAYEGLTKKELIALASERGVDVDHTATNAVLRDALSAADEAAAEPVAEEET